MTFLPKIRIALGLAHLEKAHGFDDQSVFKNLVGKFPKRQVEFITVLDSECGHVGQQNHFLSKNFVRVRRQNPVKFSPVTTFSKLELV